MCALNSRRFGGISTDQARLERRLPELIPASMYLACAARRPLVSLPQGPDPWWLIDIMDHEDGK